MGHPRLLLGHDDQRRGQERRRNRDDHRQMQDMATYLAAGWDFAGETANGAEDLWKMSDDGPGYPKLAWE